MHIISRFSICLLFVLMSAIFTASAEVKSIQSPNGDVVINVLITNNLHYQVQYQGHSMIIYSPISLQLADGRELGKNVELQSQKSKKVSKEIPVRGGIRSLIKDEYTELVLAFKGGYSVIFRAYDQGAAYRIVTNFKSPFQVTKETVQYKFPGNFETHSHIVGSYRSSFEKHFTSKKVKDLSTEEDLISGPMMIAHDDGPRFLITEADQSGYPGLFFRKYAEENIYAVAGDFAQYPKKTSPGGIKNFNQIVRETEDYIARLDGKSVLPWRVMLLGANEGELIDNTLVYQLAKAPKADFSWVKYGKVAWDWYNALNLEGVPFESGLNTDTYKYYIDFAASNNIEYVILDEGWSDQFDIQVLNEDMDLKGLIDYGKEKGVGIILWSIWYPLEEDMDQLFDWVKLQGAAGLKIDFFDRNDQEVMIAMEAILQKAARRELLVDFHGCPTLSGLERTYPNLVTYEAVKGNEFVKWDPEGEPPYHNVSLAFTRNVVGPMDYTPGAMKNATQKGFYPNFESPMSKSTRAHQLGMYVVYFSPLQMLCDAPTAYEKEPNVLRFISQMPTTWDETVVLDAKYPEFVVVARKKGEDWYIGGLNNEKDRELDLTLSFLEGGEYVMQMVTDGVNANRNAQDYQMENSNVNPQSEVRIGMKKGGGFAAILKKR